MRPHALLILLFLLFARTAFALPVPAPPIAWHLASTEQAGKPPTATLLVEGQPQTVKIGDATPDGSHIVAIGADTIQLRTAQGQLTTLYPEDSDSYAHCILAVTNTPQGPYALLQKGGYQYSDQRQAVKKGDTATFDGSLVIAVQAARAILRLKDGHLIQAPLLPPVAAASRPVSLPAKPEDRASYFANALREDNTNEARALIQADPTLVNGYDGSGWPLDIAVKGSPSLSLFLLLNAGANVNARDAAGQTPLHHVLSRGNGSSDIIQLLLDEGADIQAQDNAGDTPLLLALRRHQPISIFTLLLDRGADPARANLLAETPLHLAVSANNPEEVRALLARGVNPNLFSHTGDLPIHLAMRLPEPVPASGLAAAIPDSRGQIEQMLAEKGARLDAADATGLTPLWYALVNRDTTNVAWLRRTLPTRPTLLSLFQAAADDDVPALTRGLAANPALPEMRGPGGVSLLHVAALWGSLKAAGFLLAQGANANARDVRNWTPLHDACRLGGSLPMAALLLAQGARPSPKGPSWYDAQESPLSLAIARTDIALVRLLLAKGADPNDGQYSVSQYVIGSKDPAALDILRALLEAGADPNENESVFIPNLLGAAVRSGQTAMVRLLFQHGARIPGPTQGGYRGSILVDPLRNGYEDIAVMLLQHGADVGASGEYSTLPLAAAARSGLLEAVKLLLAKGADVNARDAQGGTALQAALLSTQDYNWPVGFSERILSYDHGARLKIIKLLLAKGASVRSKDNGDVSPLLHAIAYQPGPMVIETVADLIAHGADVNARDRNGNTPLLLAMRADRLPHPSSGQMQLIKLLLAKGASASIKDNGGHSSLLDAVAYRPNPVVTELVAGLIAHGADVNARDISGNTPLMLVVGGTRFSHSFSEPGEPVKFSDQMELVKLLLAKGADVNAINRFNESALTMVPREYGAPSAESAALIQLLHKAGAKDQPQSP